MRTDTLKSTILYMTGNFPVGFLFSSLTNFKSSKSAKHNCNYRIILRGKFIWLFSLFLFLQNITHAGKPIKYEVQIRSDNDFFIPSLNRDQYYTYGQKFMFRKQIIVSDGFLLTFERLFKIRSGTHILTIELGQDAYTPGNPNATDFRSFDRPFAGWLYVSPSVAFVDEHKIITIGADAGVLGPNSYSGDVQNYFHRKISHDNELEGWEYQVPDGFGINLSAGFIKPLASLKFADVTTENTVKIGNQSTYLEMGGRIRIGRFNKHSNTISYHTVLLDDVYKTEFFLDFSNHFRFVGYNATIKHGQDENRLYEGREANNLQTHYSAGFNVGLKRFASSFRYHFAGGDFSDIHGHSYGSVDILFRI